MKSQLPRVRTQFTPVAICVWLCWMGIPNSAEAGPVSDAQEALTKAYNDFYQALRKGKKKSPEEAQGLKDQIVAPAAQGVSKAMEQETQQVNRRAQLSRISPTGVPSASAGTPPASKGFGIPREGPSVMETPAVPPEAEAPLDATDIPKELEFPGAPKSESPLSSPSATPGARPSLNHR
jgi:hypothetical protein